MTSEPHMVIGADTAQGLDTYGSRAMNNMPFVKHEKVSIRCPHCFGTGDRWHFDRIDSKHSKECIFCEGRGVLVVEVEREAA